MLRNIQQWFGTLFRVWRREFYLVFTDVGVMIFFLALPTLYPVVYTLIYNPEIVEKIPIAVVDDSRSAASRELVRMADASQSMRVAGYAANLNEARRWMNEHKVYAVMVIPSDYARQLGRSSQATVPFYADVSLLLRYRAILSTLTDMQIALGTQIRTEKINASGMLGETLLGGSDSTPLNAESIMLGDPTSGFASFVIPGILVLILQQSLVLGVTMLAAGARERRMRNGGRDPLAIEAPVGLKMIGKALCYLVIYIPLTLYALHIVPLMFDLPHIGHVWDYLVFIFPMLLASIFMGMALSVFVTERESSMAVVVFTSVVFLFLSGLLWPRFAMSGFWYAAGSCVPATWGVEGFIRMNANGSTLAEQHHDYLMLWLLTAIYFGLAWFLNRIRLGAGRRALGGS